MCRTSRCSQNTCLPLSRVPTPSIPTRQLRRAQQRDAARISRPLRFRLWFVASSDRYNSGAFDGALKTVLAKNEAILDIVLPTLRAERAATYSPIMPISPATGRVLRQPVQVADAEAGTIRFDEDGTEIGQSALGGKAKLQWKVDFAMRWVALGVDYEMYGKV